MGTHNSKIKCSQSGCEEKAVFLYTWPSRDQAGICLICSQKLLLVAKVLDLYIQLLPISTPELLDKDTVIGPEYSIGLEDLGGLV